MFRMEFFVDDKNVAKAMLALDGLAHDLKVVPVRNVEVKKNGELRSTAAGSTMEAIANYIQANKLTIITTKQVSEALEAGGFSPGGTSNAIHNATKSKILKKRAKSRGQYVVL